MGGKGKWDTTLVGSKPASPTPVQHLNLVCLENENLMWQIISDWHYTGYMFSMCFWFEVRGSLLSPCSMKATHSTKQSTHRLL